MICRIAAAVEGVGAVVLRRLWRRWEVDSVALLCRGSMALICVESALSPLVEAGQKRVADRANSKKAGYRLLQNTMEMSSDLDRSLPMMFR